MPTKFQYTGDGGEYLEGVPARDLDDLDLARLDDDQLAAVKASTLYQTPTQPKKDQTPPVAAPAQTDGGPN